MPTWEETQSYLRGRYRLVHEAPIWLGMEWRVDVVRRAKSGPDHHPRFVEGGDPLDLDPHGDGSP